MTTSTAPTNYQLTELTIDRAIKVHVERGTVLNYWTFCKLTKLAAAGRIYVAGAR